MNPQEKIGFHDLDAQLASARWAIDALLSGAIPMDDPFRYRAWLFYLDAQAAAARLMNANPPPPLGALLSHARLAEALGTTPGNLKHHTGPIKRFLKARGLRNHPNSPDRKLGEGRPGRHADGFTSQEIQAVVQQVKDMGTLTKAFPP